MVSALLVELPRSEATWVVQYLHSSHYCGFCEVQQFGDWALN